MAKTKPSSASPSALLDASERRVFDASQGRALAAATQAQLGKLIGQTRALRDKWRDQFRGQRRSSQRASAARGVGGNERSREKSDLFADALGRLEARLAQIGGSVAQAVAAAPRRTGPTKAARTSVHRATRATTRAALAKHVTAKPVTSKPGQKKVSGVAKTKAVEAPVAKVAAPSAKVVRTADAPGELDKAAAKRPAAPKSKKRLTGRPATVAATKATGKNKKRVVSAEPASQLLAATKLKASRVRLAGLDTRLRAHTSAAGRRQQGRRDGRGR